MVLQELNNNKHNLGNSEADSVRLLHEKFKDSICLYEELKYDSPDKARSGPGRPPLIVCAIVLYMYRGNKLDAPHRCAVGRR